MHSRNPYLTPPNFVSLAKTFPALQEHLTNGQLDFQNDEAQRCLTQAIMFNDFGVQLKIPKDRLCPPVPNRVNYILWIEDVVTAHASLLRRPTTDIIGLDIGTGSTAIYPILACKMNPGWKMIGTELDDKSFDSAVHNVNSNNLQSVISVRKASSSSPILFPLQDSPKDPASRVDFTMCNPPFYSSPEEVENLAAMKDLPPNAVCTGAPIEMIYKDGGEVGFVGKMVEESLTFGTKCRWYTSMLGKLSSVEEIVRKFQETKIFNYGITQFVQGQTRRWAVAWSFFDLRLPDSVGRPPSGLGNLPKHLLPPSTTYLQTLPLVLLTKDRAFEVLRKILDEIDGLEFEERSLARDCPTKDMRVILVHAHKVTWTRSARRQLKKIAIGVGLNETSRPSALPSSASSESPSHTQSVLSCSIDFCIPEQGRSQSSNLSTTSSPTPVPRNDQSDSNREPGLAFQWLYGTEHSIFFGFAQHVGRKFVASLSPSATVSESKS